MAEHFTGASGQETDAHGIPWNEQHSTEVLRRLDFEKWRQGTTPDDHSFAEQNPFPPDPNAVTVVDTNNVTHLGEFFEKRRQRGRPFQKGWNKPGI